MCLQYMNTLHSEHFDVIECVFNRSSAIRHERELNLLREATFHRSEVSIELYIYLFSAINLVLYI